jgi:hypothetical protein
MKGWLLHSEAEAGKSIHCPRNKIEKINRNNIREEEDYSCSKFKLFSGTGTQFDRNTERVEFLSGNKKRGQTIVKILNKIHLHINKNTLTFIGQYV